jgi:hypothetical protein
MMKFIFSLSIFLSSFSFGQDVGTRVDPENYRWLYEQLFSAQNRKDYPVESFRSFKAHLQDSYQVFPKPIDLKAQNLKSVSRIQGQITYVSIFKKFYRYDISKSAQDELIHTVGINLKNGTPADIKSFTDKLKTAQDMWNAGRIKMDFKYSFKFEIEPDVSKAHFSVQVVDHTNGPYDTVWSRDWPPSVVAHEIGHMLGLGDEYNALVSQIDCLKISLMCSAWTSKPLGHEYYFILRRLMN